MFNSSILLIEFSKQKRKQIISFSLLYILHEIYASLLCSSKNRLYPNLMKMSPKSHVILNVDSFPGAQAPLPNTWMTMSNNELVKKVSLPSSDKEYVSIEKLFLSQVKTGQFSSKVKNKQNIKVQKVRYHVNRRKIILSFGHFMAEGMGL